MDLSCCSSLNTWRKFTLLLIAVFYFYPCLLWHFRLKWVTFRDVLAHNATLLAVTILTFLQCCVKLHHLHCNKRPRAGRVCPGREAVHQQRQERIEPSSQAGPLTPPLTSTTTASLMGADKRLAQSTEHTCAHLHTHTHTARTQTTCLIPASAPGSWSLSVPSSSSSSCCCYSPWVGHLVLNPRCLWERTEKGDKERCEKETRGRVKRESVWALVYMCRGQFWICVQAFLELFFGPLSIPFLCSTISLSCPMCTDALNSGLRSYFPLRSKQNIDICWTVSYYSCPGYKGKSCVVQEWWLNITLSEAALEQHAESRRNTELVIWIWLCKFQIYMTLIHI